MATLPRLDFRTPVFLLPFLVSIAEKPDHSTPLNVVLVQNLVIILIEGTRKSLVLRTICPQTDLFASALGSRCKVGRVGSVQTTRQLFRMRISHGDEIARRVFAVLPHTEIAEDDPSVL